jgi:hypothetical protein
MLRCTDMSERGLPPCHVSKEKSGDDRKGTIAVNLMLQGGGAGVHDVRDLWSSCLFHAGLVVNEAKSRPCS